MQVMVVERNAPIGQAPLALADAPTPVPGPGQVRIRVSACAICRTDLHVVEGDLPPVRPRVVPGHQVVGRIDALGAGVSAFGLGDRVGVAWLRWTCGACPPCRSGRENLCAAARFTGYHEDGGYAEQAVVDERFAYRLPEALADAEAAPLLCAGIIGYRALARARVFAGGTLALYGFGSSAHIVLQLARQRGIDVFVATRGQRHRQLAHALGARWVGAADERMPVAPDSAIVFAPVGSLVPLALAALARGGTCALAGIHMTDVPTLAYESCLSYEKSLVSVTANTRDDARELLREAAAASIRPTITTFPLPCANEALAALARGEIDGTGVLVP
jgi:propanol-preferring alcohol dehydrogenase